MNVNKMLINDYFKIIPIYNIESNMGYDFHTNIKIKVGDIWKT